MSDLKRYPQPDGSVKVIDIDTGQSWTEGVADDTPKPEGARTAPFATPKQAVEADVVELPKSRAPDMTEQLANEADRTTAPEYAVGSPELRSLLRLPFGQRAQAMRLFQIAIDAWNRMPANGTNLDDTDKLERYFGALETFNDFLRCVAVNKETYDSWVSRQDDNEFATLFFTYISRFGLGEASSSSS